MKHKIFWAYFLFGAITGIIAGLMKNEAAVWLSVGSVLGFLTGLFFESKAAKGLEPHKLMWAGFFLLFPIMFFGDHLIGSFWFDFFGILGLIGSFTLILNFVKIVRKKKK